MGDVRRLADRAEAPQTLYEGLRRRYDATTSGIDEYLQGIGGSPFGQAALGLRIPALPTPNPQSRYLFLTNQQKLAPGEEIVVREIEVGWNLGVPQGSDAGNVALEQAIVTPGFKGFDFNVSFHARFIGQDEVVRRVIGPYDTNNFSKLWAEGDALLYQGAAFNSSNLDALTGRPDYYVTLTGYVPPKLGRPWGQPLIPGLGTFYNVGKYRESVYVRGPGTIAVFASVYQSDTSTRAVPTGPGGTVYQNGLAPDLAFLLNYPTTAIPWRVWSRLQTEDA